MALWPFSRRDSTDSSKHLETAAAAAPATPVRVDPTAPLVQQRGETPVSSRALAIKALGDSGAPAAFLPLIPCLKHRQNDEKKLAAAELEKIGARRAIRPLVVAMIGLREP